MRPLGHLGVTQCCGEGHGEGSFVDVDRFIDRCCWLYSTELLIGIELSWAVNAVKVSTADENDSGDCWTRIEAHWREPQP